MCTLILHYTLYICPCYVGLCSDVSSLDGADTNSLSDKQLLSLLLQ